MESRRIAGTWQEECASFAQRSKFPNSHLLRGEDSGSLGKPACLEYSLQFPAIRRQLRPPPFITRLSQCGIPIVNSLAPWGASVVAFRLESAICALFSIPQDPFSVWTGGNSWAIEQPPRSVLRRSLPHWEVIPLIPLSSHSMNCGTNW